MQANSCKSCAKILFIIEDLLASGSISGCARCDDFIVMDEETKSGKWHIVPIVAFPLPIELQET